MFQTLVTMLVDDMRDVKKQNRELSAEVSELRAFQEQCQQRIRQLELLQEHHASRVNALMAHILTSSTSTSSSPPPSASPPTTSTSSATLAQSALLPPTTISTSDRLHMCGSGFPGATSVSQALPFLRDYTGSRLIIDDISQAFIVLRSVEKTDNPTISYGSPGACALLGYWPEELVNRHITDIGYPDIDTLAVFMAAIQCRPPPSRVATPFTTSIVWRCKSGEGCRLQCQHQNLWHGPELPQTKWHLVRFDRVVEGGLPSPAPQDLASLLRDPLLQSLLRAKLAASYATPFLLPSGAPAPSAPPLSTEPQQVAGQGNNADDFDRREQLPQHLPWPENGGLLSAVGHEEKGPDDGTLLDLDELVADMLRSPPDSSGHLFSSLADDFGLPYSGRP